MPEQRFWTLNRLIVLLLTGAFVMLLIEIRFDHRDVLGKHPVAWTPLAYSGIMTLLGILGLIFWERGGRQILLLGFTVGLVVGTLGWWFHNQGHPVRDIRLELAAWTQPVDNRSDQQQTGAPETHPQSRPVHLPPVLAPLSFAGLGLLGLLACLPQFQPRGIKTGSMSSNGGAA